MKGKIQPDVCMGPYMIAVSQAGVSPRLIKYHAKYLITTDDVIHNVDIVTSENSHITINDHDTKTCNICQGNIHLHCAKCGMRYNSEKIVTHGCKFHVET